MSSYIQLNALKCIVNIAAIPFSPNIYACALYEIPIYQNPMSMVFKIIWLYTISGYFGDILVGLLLAHRHGAFCCQSGFIQMQWRKLTFEVCVLRLDSVAKPLPHILQWNGRFLARSTWASWLRRCCCKFDNWMNALPQSGKWHLYGRSPKLLIKFGEGKKCSKNIAMIYDNMEY